MEHKRIEPTTFVLDIKEFGESVLIYQDIDSDRFNRESKRIVSDFMDRARAKGSAKDGSMKNVTYHTYHY